MDISLLQQLIAARKITNNGVNARTIRERAGLTMADMAKVVGVTESTISRWEGGSRQPRSHAAVRWAAALAELEQRRKGGSPPNHHGSGGCLSAPKGEKAHRR